MFTIDIGLIPDLILSVSALVIALYTIKKYWSEIEIWFANSLATLITLGDIKDDTCDLKKMKKQSEITKKDIDELKKERVIIKESIKNNEIRNEIQDKKLDEILKSQKRVELQLALLQDFDPQIVYPLYEEYKEMGGNHYMDILMDQYCNNRRIKKKE